MVCEKDPETRERLIRVLVNHGYLVVECEDRQTSLGAIKFETPDIVIFRLEPEEEVPAEIVGKLKEMLSSLKETLLFITSRKPELCRQQIHTLGLREDGVIPFPTTHHNILKIFKAARAL